MSKRHRDALEIQEGAVNPCGIANALVAACKECLAEKTPQRTDPAVRLIVHQLAYLCRVDEFDLGTSGEYNAAVTACKAEVAEAKPTPTPYHLTLQAEDFDTIAFVGERYWWSQALMWFGEGTTPLTEAKAWELKEKFERDTEGGHQMFPMLDPDSRLGKELHRFLEAIV